MRETFPLLAQAGREARVSCGCAVVEAAERSLADGRFVAEAAQLVLVPCSSEHLALARALAAEGGLAEPADLAAALEEAIA